ncbi:MAG: 30S ribosomal protein S12 methylthiotransferase RimO [Clostridia bacterium]|nr:30S ribosomal protein S12 methylthiotransferase RimO [Clostridia bacterium]
MKQAINVGVISLGCAKNQVDTELMLGTLQEAGYGIVQDPAQAEVLIVNTCAFLESAREEAIQTILEMGEYKDSEVGKCRVLIVAGCLAERYTEEICAELPEVDGLVGINHCADIAQVVDLCLNGNLLPVIRVSDDYGVDYMESSRVLTTPAGSAYIKIAEGCDNRCSYCAIPLIRGGFRSRPMEKIVAEAKLLALQGVREINLIAQDTTRYGTDLYGKPMLASLMEALDEIDGIQWIRVLYLYPDEMAEDLLEAMSRCKKFVHYLDLPLQHINNDILKRMNRRGTKEEICGVLRRFRTLFPDCVMRTSFIVGFPGETEAEFEELYDFIQEYEFDRVGVFCYSPEENTEAAKMENQVPEEVKKDRRNRLMELAQNISLRKNQARVGSVVQVITESVSDDGIFYVGRSYGEAPDVDGKVYFTSEEPLEPGDLVSVKVLIGEEYDVTGTVV